MASAKRKTTIDERKVIVNYCVENNRVQAYRAMIEAKKEKQMYKKCDQPCGRISLYI